MSSIYPSYIYIYIYIQILKHHIVHGKYIQLVFVNLNKYFKRKRQYTYLYLSEYLLYSIPPLPKDWLSKVSFTHGELHSENSQQKITGINNS
jgi:hypothetical protein